MRDESYSKHQEIHKCHRNESGRGTTGTSLRRSVPGKTNTKSREKSRVPRISVSGFNGSGCCASRLPFNFPRLRTWLASPTVRINVYSSSNSSSTSKSTAIHNADPVDDVASINTVSDVGPATRGLRPRPNTKRLTTSRMAPYLLTWNRLTTGSYTNAPCKYIYHSRSA